MVQDMGFGPQPWDLFSGTLYAVRQSVHHDSDWWLCRDKLLEVRDGVIRVALHSDFSPNAVIADDLQGELNRNENATEGGGGQVDATCLDHPSYPLSHARGWTTLFKKNLP